MSLLIVAPVIRIRGRIWARIAGLMVSAFWSSIDSTIVKLDPSSTVTNSLCWHLSKTSMENLVPKSPGEVVSNFVITLGNVLMVRQ